MDRVSIFQNGEVVGSIPQPDCVPRDIVSFLLDDKNHGGDPLATVRRADFTVRWTVYDNGWTKRIDLDADPQLGLGDLENMHGFIKHEDF